jgi:hypothetical protein
MAALAPRSPCVAANVATVCVQKGLDMCSGHDFVLAERLPFNVLQAVETLLGYTHPDTVEIYDLGGPQRDVSPYDSVTLADIGRLVIINGDLRAEDVARLLDASPLLAECGVPIDADLVDADPAEAGGLYDLLETLWNQFVGIRNIKQAKASKLLHLKRPNAVPLLDSHIRATYRPAAAKALDRYPHRRGPGIKLLYWAAIRSDLIAMRPFLGDIRARLSLTSDWGQTLSTLDDLRLLDILVWSNREKTSPYPEIKA